MISPNQPNMSKKIILIVVIVVIALIGVAIYNSQPKLGEQTTLSKKVETPEKAPSGEFVSALIEFKVKTEKDKYTITYPRGKFKAEELGKEIAAVLKQTDMSDSNRLSIAGGAGLNEAFYSDTTSDCGFNEPSSAWCFRLTNDKESKMVKIVVQKGKF